MRLYSADVVVIGGGAAGSVAAYKLRSKGKNVILLEKGASLRSSNFARLSGYVGCETKFQKERGIEIATKKTMYEYFVNWAKGEINPKLIRNLIEYSSEASDIIEEMGLTISAYADWVEIDGKEKYLNDMMWGPLHLINEYGSERADIVSAALNRIGVNVMYGVAAKSIDMRDGSVAGVKAVDRNGKEISVSAKAVFIATGGFGNNKDMISEFYCGAPLGNLGSKNNTGDGLNMAKDIGGVLSSGFGITCNEVCGSSLKHREYCFNKDFRMDNDNLGFAVYGGLAVDSEGERFFNEELMATSPIAYGCYPTFSVGNMYVIMDGEYYDGCCEQGIYKYLGEPDWDFGSHMFIPVLDRAKSQIEEAISEGWGFKADTLAEISAHFGLKNLETTVAKYNTMCKKGLDEEFQKSPHFMKEIKGESGYYAFEYSGSYWCTLGGVKSDGGLRIMLDSNKPIPGAYVGGCEMGSAFGRTYYDVPGSCAGLSIASGALAADEIIKYIGE